MFSTFAIEFIFYLLRKYTVVDVCKINWTNRLWAHITLQEFLGPIDA